ncbi:hypothetical protein Tco_0897240 [Tanacetum coccineum]
MVRFYALFNDERKKDLTSKEGVGRGKKRRKRVIELSERGWKNRATVEPGRGESFYFPNKILGALSVAIKEATEGGGRLTLVKSVLGSLPLYYFSIFCAPSKVLSLLESIRGRVFFGGSAEDQKISWVAWKQIMADHSMRGLGIGSFSASNLGLLATCGLDHKALIRFVQGCLL